MKRFNHKKAFTLVEILIVIGIIVLLSAIVIPNYRNANKQNALNLAANKLAQDIRSVQEMALAASECSSCPGPVSVIPLRYGIYINGADSIFYRIMAEVPTATQHLGMFDWPTNEPGDYYIGEKINFGSNIILSNASVSNCSGLPKGAERIHITFAPPDPMTEIWIGKFPPGPPPIVSCEETILILQAGTSGPTKSVVINQVGLVYVQ